MTSKSTFLVSVSVVKFSFVESLLVVSKNVEPSKLQIESFETLFRSSLPREPSEFIGPEFSWESHRL